MIYRENKIIKANLLQKKKKKRKIHVNKRRKFNYLFVMRLF